MFFYAKSRFVLCTFSNRNKDFLQQTNKLQAVTLWFNYASDWSEHNKHSRHILGVHGFCCFIVNMDLFVQPLFLTSCTCIILSSVDPDREGLVQK